MTREEAKDLVSKFPLIQAYAEGKTIQGRVAGTTDHWKDIGPPDFDAHPDFYRIKPEPREFWVQLFTNGNLSVAGNAFTTEYGARHHFNGDVIHVREII